MTGIPESLLGVGVPLGPADIFAGPYFSLAKLITMTVLVLLWALLAPKLSKDALELRLNQPLWAGLLVGSAGLGILLWLVLPVFALGLVLYVLLITGVMVGYIFYRNAHVEANQRIGFGNISGLFTPKKKSAPVAPVTKIKIYDRDSRIVSPRPNWTEQDVTAYNQLQTFLYEMLWRRASEADISPEGDHARVRLVVDGMVTDSPAMELPASEAMIQFVKPLAGMNAEDRRRPQKGKLSVDLAQGATDVVLATAGSTGGQRLQLRVRQEIIQTRLGELGMSPAVLAKVREFCRQPGMIIACGRGGSGLTSTLYSLLREHDSFTQQIVTMEKNPAVEMENTTQNRYESDDQLADALESALRRDPDVIMLDSCHDARTAELLGEAAAQKSVVLGMSAAEAFIGLAKWVKVYGQAEGAMKNLRGVLCQMLLRKLCPTCKEKYRPDPQILAKANIPADKVEAFYRAPAKPRTDEKGNVIVCPTCQNTGYFGRTGVFELMEITDEIRQLVASGAAVANIKAACRKNRMLYLQEEALAKVIAGDTSVQEVIRASQETKKQ